jgi:molybdate transport system substrate-binding protein
MTRIHDARAGLLLRGLACLLVVSLGCQADPDSIRDAKSAEQRTIRVAAAANLKFAFDEIQSAFQTQHPDVKVQIIYGSSGSFFAQLSQRAPYDIFFSADTTYPQRLLDQGLVAEDGYFPYARGRIVIWVRQDSPLDLQQLGIEALVDPSAGKIAIANPKLAPYGQAAESAMKHLGVYNRCQDRLVFGENITQTAQFVESGAADIGIIALSLALAPPLKDRGRYWEIPVDAYEPLEQAGVLLSSSDRLPAARRLQAFVTGEEGQKILRQYGYSAPGR